MEEKSRAIGAPGDIRLRGVHFANASRRAVTLHVLLSFQRESIRVLLSGLAKGGILDEYTMHLKH